MMRDFAAHASGRITPVGASSFFGFPGGRRK
jgi:hypothetical protein